MNVNIQIPTSTRPYFIIEFGEYAEIEKEFDVIKRVCVGAPTFVCMYAKTLPFTITVLIDDLSKTDFIRFNRQQVSFQDNIFAPADFCMADGESEYVTYLAYGGGVETGGNLREAFEKAQVNLDKSLREAMYGSEDDCDEDLLLRERYKKNLRTYFHTHRYGPQPSVSPSKEVMTEVQEYMLKYFCEAQSLFRLEE